MMSKNNVILIIDDSPEDLRVLGEMLEHAGYEVLIANDGHQAFEVIEAL